MPLLTPNPIKRICIVRLSAIGDVAQAYVAVAALKRAQPQLRITWIIGKAEYELLASVSDIDFIVFDKIRTLRSCRMIARQLRYKQFDALLLMQYSLRAGLLSLFIAAPLRIGYPRALSRELHGLFVNTRIAMPSRTHVLDIYYAFVAALGLKEVAQSAITYHRPEDAQFAKLYLPEDKKVLLISPCSSRRFKNWLPQRYAAVASAAMQRYDMHVVLVGSDSRIERLYENRIQRCLATPCASLVGKTNLRQLAAIVARSHLVIAPDSAIVHIASAMRTPVIGLYAATNAERSGPYHYLKLCINRYPEALKKYCRKSMTDRSWGKHIRRSEAMELISEHAVIAQLERFMASR